MHTFTQPHPHTVPLFLCAMYEDLHIKRPNPDGNVYHFRRQDDGQYTPTPIVLDRKRFLGTTVQGVGAISAFKIAPRDVIVITRALITDYMLMHIKQLVLIANVFLIECHDGLELLPTSVQRSLETNTCLYIFPAAYLSAQEGVELPRAQELTFGARKTRRRSAVNYGGMDAPNELPRAKRRCVPKKPSRPSPRPPRLPDDHPLLSDDAWLVEGFDTMIKAGGMAPATTQTSVEVIVDENSENGAPSDVDSEETEEAGDIPRMEIFSEVDNDASVPESEEATAPTPIPPHMPDPAAPCPERPLASTALNTASRDMPPVRPTPFDEMKAMYALFMRDDGALLKALGHKE